MTTEAQIGTTTTQVQDHIALLVNKMEATAIKEVTTILDIVNIVISLGTILKIKGSLHNFSKKTTSQSTRALH